VNDIDRLLDYTFIEVIMPRYNEIGCFHLSLSLTAKLKWLQKPFPQTLD
jgi:hypothetical protein